MLGQRGITPAFGYSAPYSGASGTSTHLICALPSAHYDPSDFLTTIPAFSLCRLVRRYYPPWQSDEDLPRSPGYFDDMPCSQTPGMPDITAHSVMSDGVFWVCQVMDHPKYSLNGALSLQPEGLRPTTSLSTLDPHGYPYQPKTRYQVRWVPASWAALSAASNTAPRGARQLNFSTPEKSRDSQLIHYGVIPRHKRPESKIPIILRRN